SNALFFINDSAMGSCVAASALLKAWLSWLRSGFLWRLLGLPAALLALHLEIYGSSPAATSLILHRLSRRLRFPAFCVPAAKGVARKRSMTLNDKDHMLASPSGAASPSSPSIGQLNKHLSRSSVSSLTSNNSPTDALSRPAFRPSMPSHSRSMSHADVVKNGKRLSLHFPIQPAAGSPMTPAFSSPRPQSWMNSPMMSPGVNVTQLQPLNTALANYSPDKVDDEGSAQWLQQEMERRKALLSSTKTSSRKVFSGSRHMRTLSLLSPDQQFTPSFPQPLDLNEPKEDLNKRPLPLIRHATSPDMGNHVPNNNDGERYDLGGLSTIQKDALLRTGKQMATDFKDGLLTFIEDIRQATVGDEAIIGADGVGAPAAKPTKTNRKTSEGRPGLNRSSSSKKVPSGKLIDIADDFWKSHGLNESKPTTTTTNKKTSVTTSNAQNTRTPQKSTPKVAEEFEESWDNWDTPNATKPEPSTSSSSDESDADSSLVSGRSSARTSTRYHSKRHDSKASSLTGSSSMGPLDENVLADEKRNSIPWPDLVKLSPTNLKRTASHLMKEWEKNLTPPPESREGSHVSGEFFGRSEPGLP
ncbi:hypothetical protein BCR34DRAFT_500391, partial [Clohesyomyces aquaticus]